MEMRNWECGMWNLKDGSRREPTVQFRIPHSAFRIRLLPVLSLSQRVAPQLFADLGVFAPEVVAHGQGGEAVADRHVPPREVSQQRFGEQRDENVEPHLEEAESHD